MLTIPTTPIVGERGTPKELSRATETIAVTTPQGRREWKVLKIRYYLRSKLRGFYDREGTNDYKDLCWMIFQYPEKVREIAPDVEEVYRRLFADAYAKRESDPQRVEWVEKVLGLRSRTPPKEGSSSRDAGGSSSRSADPRAADRRYADPRYQSSGSSSRRADPGYQSSSSTSRPADPRYADPRYQSSGSSSRALDPRYQTSSSTSRSANAAHADPRYADPRYADPRYADPRYDPYASSNRR
jgi:hypothetical protein